MISYSVYNHPLEGSVYKKFKYTFEGVEYARRPCIANSITGNAIGGFFGAWLRSSYGGLNQKVLMLGKAGPVSSSNAYYTYGVSVGFTLER